MNDFSKKDEELDIFVPDGDNDAHAQPNPYTQGGEVDQEDFDA